MQLESKHTYGLLGGGVLAVVAVVLWFLFGGGAPPAGQQGRDYVLPVTLTRVVRRDVAPRAQLTGSVRSVRRVRLGFTVAGVVSSLAVGEADRIARGQTLATIDAGDQRLAVATRRAELVQTSLELAELRAGTRPEERARLEAELKIAAAEEALAVLELDRARTLLTQKVISLADREALEARLEAARGKRLAAQAEVDQGSAGPRPETLAVAAAKVERAQANLDIALRELAKTRLRAPWDGVVGTRFVAPGAVLAAGAPVFELIDADHVEVELQVPSRYALRLGTRPRALISCEEAPEFRVEARVDAQLPTADELSRNFTALVPLDASVRGPDGRAVTAVFKPGMFVRVTVQLEPVKGELVVPADSIRQTERGPIVVCARQAPAGEGDASKPRLVAAWIPVRLLGADAEGRAVEPLGEAQLTTADQVVVTGVDLAFPGVPLQPRPDPTAGDAPSGSSPTSGK